MTIFPNQLKGAMDWEITTRESPSLSVYFSPLRISRRSFIIVQTYLQTLQLLKIESLVSGYQTSIWSHTIHSP